MSDAQPSAGLELAKLTWPEARARFTDRLVAVVPTGATEPHGPHLPLDVDVTISSAQAKRTAELLTEQGVDALVLPPVAYGVTFFTDGFEGRVTLRPGTFWALLEDLVESLSEQGVRQVLFCNAHLETGQIKVLRGIAKDYAEPRQGKATVRLVDITRRRYVERLGEEFQSGDCHAGRYETSIVMAADPEGVREAERLALPKKDVELVAKMQAGARSFREVGADQAYCGAPAEASGPEGDELIEALAGIGLDIAREAWPQLFGAHEVAE
ncbi:MAG: creatininase family protein [Planctomycetota bacterium]